MKTLIISLLLLLFGGTAQAAITERVIHAGDTPLTNSCTVVQTAPLELTVFPCTFTTTGEAKIFNVIESLLAQTGIGQLAKAIQENKAEWMPGGLRIRAWLRTEFGDVIERSVMWNLPVTSVITFTPGDTYYLYLVKKAGVTMGVIALPVTAPRPAGYIHYLAFEIVVPLGTTDLNSVNIEVFTVKPGHAPTKSLFKK